MSDQQRCVADKIISARYGIGLQTLRNWRTERKGPPYIKVYGRVLYDLSDTDKWFSERKIDPEQG